MIIQVDLNCYEMLKEMFIIFLQFKILINVNNFSRNQMKKYLVCHGKIIFV